MKCSLASGVPARIWGYQRHGINPDLVVMGKPMGNGLPIAAVVARPELLADFGRKVRYFNTFAGNPVCIAAAQAVLNEIQNKNLMENSHLLGDYLLNGFRVIAENYTQIGDVRGAGLYHAIEFVKDPDTKEPDTGLTRKVVSELRERRILISTTGKGENSLKIRPLLTFNQDNADLLLNQFEDTLKAVIR